jgi:hypothetical protein
VLQWTTTMPSPIALTTGIIRTVSFRIPLPPINLSNIAATNNNKKATRSHLTMPRWQWNPISWVMPSLPSRIRKSPKSNTTTKRCLVTTPIKWRRTKMRMICVMSWSLVSSDRIRALTGHTIPLHSTLIRWTKTNLL